MRESKQNPITEARDAASWMQSFECDDLLNDMEQAGSVALYADIVVLDAAEHFDITLNRGAVEGWLLTWIVERTRVIEREFDGRKHDYQVMRDKLLALREPVGV